MLASSRAPTDVQQGGMIITSRRSSPPGGRPKAALMPKGSAKTTVEPRAASEATEGDGELSPRAWRHRPAWWLQAGQLVSGKIPQTLKWNRRCLASIMPSTIVDACKAREHCPPPSSDSNASSRTTAFVSITIDEIKPGAPKGLVEVQGGRCLERTGTTTTTKGSHTGRERAIQQRCKVCLKNRAEEDKTRHRRA